MSRVFLRVFRVWVGAAYEDGMEWSLGGFFFVRICVFWVTLVI